MRTTLLFPLCRREVAARFSVLVSVKHRRWLVIPSERLLLMFGVIGGDVWQRKRGLFFFLFFHVKWIRTNGVRNKNTHFWATIILCIISINLFPCVGFGWV